MILLEKLKILTPLQILWEIWANLLLPKALKSCPKSNKSLNLVTLSPTHLGHWPPFRFRLKNVLRDSVLNLEQWKSVAALKIINEIKQRLRKPFAPKLFPCKTTRRENKMSSQKEFIYFCLDIWRFFKLTWTLQSDKLNILLFLNVFPSLCLYIQVQ